MQILIQQQFYTFNIFYIFVRLSFVYCLIENKLTANFVNDIYIYILYMYTKFN